MWTVYDPTFPPQYSTHLPFLSAASVVPCELLYCFSARCCIMLCVGSSSLIAPSRFMTRTSPPSPRSLTLNPWSPLTTHTCSSKATTIPRSSPPKSKPSRNRPQPLPDPRQNLRCHLTSNNVKPTIRPLVAVLNRHSSRALPSVRGTNFDDPSPVRPRWLRCPAVPPASYPAPPKAGEGSCPRMPFRPPKRSDARLGQGRKFIFASSAHPRLKRSAPQPPPISFSTSLDRDMKR